MQAEIKALPLAQGECGVVLAETATGIVLLPDGSRYLGSGPYHSVFESLNRAYEHARNRVDQNPQWECSITNSTGKRLMFVKAT